MSSRVPVQDVGEHVGLATREADDAPVEGADDHQEQRNGLEYLSISIAYLLVKANQRKC